MHEYDVNAYLRKKRKRQHMKDMVLIALFFINLVLCGVSILMIDSELLIPAIVGACASLYLFAFAYANSRGDE